MLPAGLLILLAFDSLQLSLIGNPKRHHSTPSLILPTGSTALSLYV